VKVALVVDFCLGDDDKNNNESFSTWQTCFFHGIRRGKVELWSGSNSFCNYQNIKSNPIPIQSLKLNKLKSEPNSINVQQNKSRAFTHSRFDVIKRCFDGNLFLCAYTSGEF
jgi:hypothetical protein